MDNLARLRPNVSVYESGTVTEQREGVTRVRTQAGEFTCARAVSCLVEPREGDRVAVFADASGAAYVLAVLERADGAPVDLVVDGDASLKARGGALRLQGPRGVHLESAAEVTAVTGRFRLVAERAELATQRVLAVGQVVEAQVRKVTVFSKTLDRFVDHVIERCRTSVRVVDESDTVRAKRIDLKADELLAVRGENAVVTAEELVKVDGRQIHFG